MQQERSQTQLSSLKVNENTSYSSKVMSKIIFIRLFCTQLAEGSMTHPIIIAALEIINLIIPIQLILFLAVAQGHLSFVQIQKTMTDMNAIFGIVQNITLIVLILKILFLGYLFLSKDTKGFLYTKILRFTCFDIFSDKIILTTSGILLWFDYKLNIPIFVGASFLTIANGFVLENYVNQYDITYNTSVSTTTIFSLFKISSYVINFLFFAVRLKIIFQIYTVVALVYFVWFMKKGFKKYIFEIPMLCTQIYSAAFISTTFILLSSELLTQPHPKFMSHLVQILVLFLLCLAFLAVSCKIRLRMRSRVFGREEIKTLEYILCTDENCCDLNSNKNNQLIFSGLLKLHQINKCPNPQCYTSKGVNNFEYNESSSLKLSNGSTQNTLKVKLLLKCLYETCIEANPKDSQIMIDYLQFLFNQLKSEYLSCALHLRLKAQKFTFFDQIKIDLIFELLKERRRKLNLQLYQKKMEIQSVLETTLQFDSMIVEIRKYLKGQKQLWKCLKENEINVWQMRKKSKELFKFLQKINGTWEHIQPYFPINKLWRYSFWFTSIFLNNKRPSRKQVEQMIQCQIWIQTIKNEPIFLSKEKEFPNKDVVFHHQSFYLHATQYNEALIIRNVSKNVQESTGYIKSQLLNCNIETLMPAQVAQIHHEKLKQWLEKGFSSSEQAYHIRQTKMVNNEQEEINVIKYFKIFINTSYQLEYVCLLKANQPIEEDFSKYEPRVSDDEKQFLLPLREQVSTRRNKFQQKDQIRQEITEGYQLQQSLKKYSKVQENQFIKQESFSINEHDHDVSIIKWTLRIFTLIILIFVPVTMLALDRSLTQSIAYSSRYFTFMATYRIPMILGNNYYKYILQVGDQANVVSQIQTLSDQMREVLAKPDVIRTVYDRVINKPKMYHPFMPTPINQNMSYNQVDLLYVMSSSIATLQTLPIDRQGKQFNMFMSYIKPSYDDLINGTKNTFHEQFQLKLNQIQMNDVFYLVGLSVLALVVIAFTIYKIKYFLLRLQTIMKVFVEIKEDYQKKIFQYWQSLDLQFKDFSANHCNLTYLATSGKLDEIASQKSSENKNNVILNNRNKAYISDRKFSTVKLKAILLVFLAILLVSSAKIAVTLNNIKQINILKVFEEDGWSFLKYFPTATVVGLGSMEKLYSQTYPNQTTFHPDRYVDVLASMKMVGQFQFLPGVEDASSVYYATRRNYFFGNPCRYNPKVLDNIGIGISTCQTIIDESFTRGLASYMRTGQSLAEAYIQGRTNLTKAKISEFSLSVAVLSGYVLDAIVVWGNQFNERVRQMRNTGIMRSIFLCIGFLTLHILLFE